VGRYLRVNLNPKFYMDRYQRQTLLPAIGTAGQSRLAAARVLLVGCGALGCAVADQLVRAGVGKLRLVDRDVVELTNLQRQMLFDEADAREGTPKAVAAGRRLLAINSSVQIEPVVTDFHSGNAQELIRCDLIIDGTDNVETRYLINDVAVKHGIPWVYGACVGTDGRVMFVDPGKGPCLRCVFPEPPSTGELPTCDTAGVLGSAAMIVASLQVIAAIKFLVGETPSYDLSTMDLWKGRFHSIDTGERLIDCPCCGQRRFEFLDRPVERSAVQLCGRNSVQIRPARAASLELKDIARKLGAVGPVQAGEFLVRCQPLAEANVQLTVFADGRTVVQGTSDITRARTLVSRYVGL
jgi:molybdopterin-synthase adenylyltransferase